MCLVLAVGGAAVWWWTSNVPRVFDRGAETLLARTRVVADGARVTPRQGLLDALGESPVCGSSYRFDDHLGEAGIDESGASRQASATDPVHRIPLLPLNPARQEYEVQGETLKLRWREGEVLISPPLAIPVADAAAIEVRLRTTEGREMELAWSKYRLTEWKPGDDWPTLGRLAVRTVPDGAWHRYRINASNALRLHFVAGDVIRTLMLRPSDVPDDLVEVDSLRVIPRRVRYSAAPAGVGAETLGRERRQVIFCNPPVELSYSLDVPADRPLMSFGMGVYQEGAPLRFEVAVTSGGERRVLMARACAWADRWRDVSLDLGPWAGRRVDLTLRVAGDAGNVAFWSNPVVRGAPARRCNVVLLLEDALRADHLSLYGYPLATSPVTERWARDGVVFSAAFAQGTKTRPSVPSLMTSLYPTANGVLNHQHMLDERHLTLAEILRQQGFVTASFIQNGNAGPWGGLHQGFSYLRDGSSLSGKAQNLYGRQLFDWLDRHSDENFFLYLHVLDPHGPYDPPPPYDAWYRELGPVATAVAADPFHDPDWVREPTVEGRRLLYDGEVRHNDELFSSLLTKLDELGIREHTLIVFLADHGEHLGEHDLWEHKPPGYVQVLHVPLIMVSPGRLPAGRRISAPVQLVDVTPTILDLVGVGSERIPFQGESLLPLIRGPGGRHWRDRLLWSDEGMSYRPDSREDVWASVFFRRWHLLRSPDLTPIRAFDLARDPQEERPLVPPSVPVWLTVRGEAFMGRMRRANDDVRRAILGDGEDTIQWEPEFEQQLRDWGYEE